MRRHTGEQISRSGLVLSIVLCFNSRLAIDVRRNKNAETAGPTVATGRIERCGEAFARTRSGGWDPALVLQLTSTRAAGGWARTLLCSEITPQRTVFTLRDCRSALLLLPFPDHVQHRLMWRARGPPAGTGRGFGRGPIETTDTLPPVVYPTGHVPISTRRSYIRGVAWRSLDPERIPSARTIQKFCRPLAWRASPSPCQAASRKMPINYYPGSGAPHVFADEERT